jgi:hypothetical protein
LVVARQRPAWAVGFDWLVDDEPETSCCGAVATGFVVAEVVAVLFARLS